MITRLISRRGRAARLNEVERNGELTLGWGNENFFSIGVR